MSFGPFRPRIEDRTPPTKKFDFKFRSSFREFPTIKTGFHTRELDEFFFKEAFKNDVTQVGEREGKYFGDTISAG